MPFTALNESLLEFLVPKVIGPAKSSLSKVTVGETYSPTLIDHLTLQTQYNI